MHFLQATLSPKPNRGGDRVRTRGRGATGHSRGSINPHIFMNEVHIYGCHMVPRFPVPRFPPPERWSCVFQSRVFHPLKDGPAFSSPAFSTPVIWSRVSSPAFSSPAFSASPTYVPHIHLLGAQPAYFDPYFLTLCFVLMDIFVRVVVDYTFSFGDIHI